MSDGRKERIMKELNVVCIATAIQYLRPFQSGSRPNILFSDKSTFQNGVLKQMCSL